MPAHTPVLRRLAIRVLILGVLTVGCGVLRAGVVYSNFGNGDAYSAGNGLIVTSDSSAGSSVAVSFVPTANYTLTSIELVATDIIPDDLNSAALGIFADNGGQPFGAALESFTLGPLGQFGETVPVTTVTSLLQPLLLANTTYWVGLEAAPGDLIVWNQNTTGATGFSQTDGSGSWSASSQFQGVVEIDGTLPPVGFTSSANFTASEADVPEPRAFWMMALGLAVIARTGRRRAIPALPPPETTTR